MCTVADGFLLTTDANHVDAPDWELRTRTLSQLHQETVSQRRHETALSDAAPPEPPVRWLAGTGGVQDNLLTAHCVTAPPNTHHRPSRAPMSELSSYKVGA